MRVWRDRLSTLGIWLLVALIATFWVVLIGFLFFNKPIRAVYCLFASCPYELQYDRPGDEYGDDPYGPYN